MKNTATNSLKYTGIVTLSQYIGNKKVKLAQVHNSGESPLFNFFSDCLLGHFDVARLNRPTKIMLLNHTKEDDNSDSYESVSPFIHLLGEPEKLSEQSTSKVSYNFTIPRDILEGSTFNSIGLYADNINDSSINSFSAVCHDVVLDMTNMTASSILIIDWELIISNI